ncbi:ABC transporter ATP-binding protein [Niabella drilacis]|uniref:ABC-2 type transport system ATP-binding protein n=1 Tax=Niabella drilacis (strain DSM 25811 / CCM 8410 / CCUG 62505 / LMG 26954 / E90) TaxID=1285928 RepID=A0A1G6LSF6_NIADE|nr:ATP-binding cassette domain-containing protein [Niabella drilacis]SDC46121.1 ABC-2 type transport system ATP-binding protein [Niabella drilacis]
MLEITSIVKQYNRQLILNIPSLHLQKGIYWLKGENGSGKTTFLKMAAALIPFKGTISVNGISQKASPLRYRQQISWAEAEPLYPGFLTGNELIALYRQIRNVTGNETATLIRLLDATSYLHNRVDTYSAGMLKKLSLILAFTGAAGLILLDEPFITLDAQACVTLEQLILERNRENDTAFILSTHQDPGEDLRPFCKQLFVRNKTILS